MKNNNVKNVSAPKSLQEFAYKQQAPKDAAGNLVLNAVVTWFLLAGTTIVPVIPPPFELKLKPISN